MGVKAVTSREEFVSIINSGKVVAFDFWATWCGPCRAISPIFEELSSKTEGVEFYKVDVDEQPDIAQECNIRAMPTFIVFKDGAKVSDLTGANPGGLTTLIEGAKALV